MARQKAEGRRMNISAWTPSRRPCSSFILHPSSLGRRTGFSFTEVLFAVIILGIGFIMIAAIFPVAIQQTKTTTEETTASTIARGAVNYLQSAMTDPLMPPTTTIPGDSGDVLAISPNQSLTTWQVIQGNVILQNDSRYGWVALYRRGLDSDGNALPYAQVFVIPAESRSAPTFTTNDIQGGSAADAVNLQARQTSVSLQDGGNPGIDTITFSGTNLGAAAEGAYVIIKDTANVGRIFRVGNATGNLNEYELMPGSDMEEDDGSNFSATAYVVGRTTRNPTVVNPTFEGPAMDIGIYTTFVKVN